MHPGPRGDVAMMFPTRQGRDRVGGGMIFSLLLHAVALGLLILVLPHLLLAPPVEMLVPIDLVQLGERDVAPPAPAKAAVPQAEARETAAETPALPVPREAPPPPPPEATPADAREEVAGRAPVVAPVAKLETPHAKTRPKSERPAPLVPPPKAPPVEDLAARLESLSRQQQLQARLPANPRRQDGIGASNVTASNDGAPGREASSDLKDFIRVQIARHWRPDLAALGAGEFVVAIHLSLNRDGSVGGAEIVDDPRHGDSAAYRSLALSARNAALLASPLTLPQGRYDAVRDITIRLSTRDALR
jgi:hypothetical protein